MTGKIRLGLVVCGSFVQGFSLPSKWRDLMAFLLPVLFSCATPFAQAVDYYVSPDGDDRNPGTVEKPFAAIERARDAVRELKEQGVGLSQSVNVYLRGGTYFLDRKLDFLGRDSGTDTCSITYLSYPGEKAVLSGGRRITGWKRDSGNLWSANVPEVKDGTWYFHQIWIDGRRAVRARSPNKAFHYIESPICPLRGTEDKRAARCDPNSLTKKGFIYRDGDLADYENREDVLVVIFHSWTTSIHFITGLDEQKRVVKLAPRSGWPIGYWWPHATRYLVENAFELLDEPGEWYLNRKTGTLYYYPLPGEDMETAEVIAPVVEQTLINIGGGETGETGSPIENLHFRDLVLCHVDCVLSPDMQPDVQASVYQRALVHAVFLRNSSFENLEIAHTGEHGIWLGKGCRDNVIRGCCMHELGGGAVFVGERGNPATETDAVLRNMVDNCLLTDGSHIFRGTQGVWIGRASHNTLSHNDISEFMHLGVSIGWCWGYAPSSANHNIIEFNHVHHIAKGIFSDGGGIYTLGISPGTVIRNNLVHDVTPTPLMPDGGVGIYNDEGSTHIVIENNIVYNVGTGAFHTHYGKENTVRNNIFAFAHGNQITCARKEDHVSYFFTNNIVLSKCGEVTASKWSPARANTVFDRNLYWDISGNVPSFSGLSFEDWQATGRDEHSLIADPLFYDAENHDFRLKPESPAAAIEFSPIDVGKIGLYGDAAWVRRAGELKHRPVEPVPPPPPAPPDPPIREDFETMEVGKPPTGACLSGASGPGRITVTDETAATGKHSLKFTDAPGQKFTWQPHLYYTRKYDTGTVRFSCNFMNSDKHPAEFWIAIRDYASKRSSEFLVGPTVAVSSKGEVTAGGKPVCNVRNGSWVHLEMVFTLGDTGLTQETSKTYTLTVAAGEETQTVQLPYVDEAFSQCTWLGFASAGEEEAEFYIDTIILER